MIRDIVGKIVWLLCLVLVTGVPGITQVQSGTIEFERRTNVLKLYQNEKNMQGMMDYIKKNKIQKETFYLRFNDSLSVFTPKESVGSGWASWLTQRNSTVQDFKTKKRLQMLDIWGDNVYVKDTLKKREWKITYDKRMIAGHECRKAIWQKDDTTKIYAWYSEELQLSTGPETFNGLPGTILGLATEDGGVVYFAKKIELTPTAPHEFMPKYKEKDLKTEDELRKEIEARFSKMGSGAKIADRLFTW